MGDDRVHCACIGAANDTHRLAGVLRDYSNASLEAQSAFPNVHACCHLTVSRRLQAHMARVGEQRRLTRTACGPLGQG
jgi:hypothetical protein